MAEKPSLDGLISKESQTKEKIKPLLHISPFYLILRH
jgi:hypothetical protein